MKLLVCYKVIPDLDQVLWDEDVLTSEMEVDTSYVKNTINCFDESSLEFGLRLSDEAEGLNLHIEKSALTVADQKAELVMQTLNALCYDHVIRFDPEHDVRFTAHAVGQQIVNYVKENPQDLVLLGRQSPQGNNFATGQYVAEKLNMPLIANVVDIHVTADETFVVQQEIDGAVYEQEVKGPVVCTIGNAIISKLRVPTLKNRMKYGKRPFDMPEFSDEEHIYHAFPEKLVYVDRHRAGEIADIPAEEGMDFLENILAESEGLEKGNSEAKEKLQDENAEKQNKADKTVLFVSSAKETENDSWFNDYLNLKDQWMEMGYDSMLYLYGHEGVKVDDKYADYSNKIFVDDSWYLSPSMLANHISDIIEQNDITGVFVLEDSFSNEIAGVLAAKKEWNCVLNGINFSAADDKICLEKMVYNNNIKSELVLPAEKFVISSGTMKSRKFEGTFTSCRETSVIEKVECAECPSYVVNQKIVSKRDNNGLSNVLIAVGKGVDSKQDVETLRDWAKSRGYMFGVSRPVAMGGWAGMDEIIGVSGNIHAPKVTIAIGVSGTAAFYAGIEQSDKIVAVNTNDKAALIKMADVSIIEDYSKIFKGILE